MSARASAYAKSLLFCPNGERITRGEKLVLISLADSHQDKGKHFTYPSIETIATDALCDRRSCQRHLEALERKGVIRRLRPARQGAGMTTFYFFLELEEVPEGWQNAALFSEHKGGIRAAKGRQKGGKTCNASITNINQEQELTTTPPAPPMVTPTGKSGPLGTPTTGGSAELSDVYAPKEPAGHAGAAPETPALSAEQWRYVDRLREEGHEREAARYEAWYREDNAAAARKQREREERERSALTCNETMRGLMPTQETACAWVMRACGFAPSRRGRGLEQAIEAVLGLEHERGVEWHLTALKMSAAWQHQAANAERLRYVYGPGKFFREGHWRDVRRWAWDEKKLEAAGRAAVGMPA